MDTTNINDFNIAPVVREYLLSENTHYKLEIKLSNILEKLEGGEELNSMELMQHFQFQRFFTWKQEITYQVGLQLTGTWYGSEKTISVDKDLFYQIEEGDTDSDYSELEVDPYDLDDPSYGRDGLDIEESRVSEKHLWINVFDLKIKDEFNKNVAPDAGTMIEGGAA